MRPFDPCFDRKYSQKHLRCLGSRLVASAGGERGKAYVVGDERWRWRWTGLGREEGREGRGRGRKGGEGREGKEGRGARREAHGWGRGWGGNRWRGARRQGQGWGREDGGERDERCIDGDGAGGGKRRGGDGVGEGIDGGERDGRGMGGDGKMEGSETQNPEPSSRLQVRRNMMAEGQVTMKVTVDRWTGNQMAAIKVKF